MGQGLRDAIPETAVHLCVDMQRMSSSSDESHDALMGLYHERFSQQVETADSAEILAAWR